MRPVATVQRLRGLPPIVVINLAARALGQEPPGAAAQEIIVVHRDPNLRQALHQVAGSLGVLFRCGRRAWRQYGGAINRGHAYANCWYTRDRGW
ncbi:MAG TPA: hypothetical protein VH253_12360 [Phycisphaerae bacterium]|nr:hypothetical protein [Phycisphaerae bacterium]